MVGLLAHLVEPRGQAELMARAEALIAFRQAEAREQRAIDEERAMVEAEEVTIREISEVLVTKLRFELLEELEARAHPYTPSTLKAYSRDFNAFKETAKRLGLPYLPASPEIVAFHLSFRLDSGIKILTRIAAAISATHAAADLEDPTRDPIVGAVLRRAKNMHKPAELKTDE